MILLIGNPNSGKSTIFNKITKLNERVGNYSGVTVECKIGKYKSKKIVDCPGIYSLHPYTDEEKITINFLKNNSVDLIVNIIDINNLNRSLYLTQLLKNLKIPIVVVLNKKSKGINIDINLLERLLNIEIINLSKSLKDIDKLLKIIENITSNNKKIVIPQIDEKSAIENYKKIDTIMNSILINDIKDKKQIKYHLSNYKYLNVVLNFLILIIVYFMCINVIGDFFTNIINVRLEYIFKLLVDTINQLSVSTIFKSLLINGIIKSLSNLFLFIPQILIISLIFSLLNDSGYITKLALNFEFILNKIGLSSKSFFSLLMGNTCSAQAILSTKTIKSKKEKYLTCMLIPMIPCSAKIEIILIILTTYYNNSIYIYLSFYIIIFITIILTSCIFKKEKNRYFIMELQDIKVPNFKYVMKDTWYKLKEFITRIFTIILFFSISTWFLTSFNMNFRFINNINNSLLSIITNKFSFFTLPFTGIKSYQILTSILSGMIAKEQVVSTIYVLDIKFTNINAYTFVLFNLLTVPCINTLVALKNECGTKFMIFTCFIEIFTAFIISTLIFILLNIL